MTTRDKLVGGIARWCAEHPQESERRVLRLARRLVEHEPDYLGLAPREVTRACRFLDKVEASGNALFLHDVEVAVDRLVLEQR